MRYVDRGLDAPPACLSAKNKDGKTELERVREHLGAKATESFGFVAYKGEEVKRRLEQLFHGKCAYCETFYASSEPVDVEHFRPKGRVHGDANHPGYWWVAMDWTNLLPSCIDCNRKRKQTLVAVSDSLLELYESSGHAGKQDSFPIEGTRAQPEAADFTDERALLLNPCHDDPSEHLEFHFGDQTPTALVLPRAVDPGASPPRRSVRGATSIQVYGLNRLRLVQDRTRVLRRLEFLESLAVDLAAMADEVESSDAPTPARAAEIAKRLRDLTDRVVREMRQMAAPEEPYSTMARAWIARYLDALA
jgi:uncharacterized protein (TIGR02646 family)